MRSGNPALNANTFLDASSGRVVSAGDSTAMTLSGTVNKTAFLLLLVLVTASYTWSRYAGPESMAVIMPMLLMAYRSGLIRASENFKLGVVAATGGIALLYLANIVMGFFGHSIGFIHDNGWVGIGFSAVVVVAALNLVLDFDFIEAGAEAGAPKYMEWFGAFGLVVTLVWLYIEILRLLSKLQSRN